MAKRLPRIEIQIYSNSTEQPGHFRFSPFRLIWWLVGIGVAVAGIIYFNPGQIWDKATDFRLWRMYKDNLSVQRELAKAKTTARYAEANLEETSVLRDTVAAMAGITYSEDDIPEHKKPVKEAAGHNLQRIREAHRTFFRFRKALWENPDLAESMPLLHPLRKHNHVANRFRVVRDPFTGLDLPHRGVDFVAGLGDTVIATGSGLVSMVSTERGLGLTLKIRHTENVESLYGHLGQVLVSTGRPVRKGEPIALVGRTGRTTGPMVHYEVRLQGQPIDPENYFITP